jgi:P pilus assembly chaperone PapD
MTIRLEFIQGLIQSGLTLTSGSVNTYSMLINKLFLLANRDPASGSRPYTNYIAALLSILAFLPTNAIAQGNLLITPRRVVFEGNVKSIDLNLANSGQDTATYAISLVQIRMKDEGGFETITEPDPGQLFADKNIRFYPRTVTLGPAEAQVIKVQLIKPNELAAGEYRSHFYFRAVPRTKPLGEEEAPKDSSTISVQLTPIFGITIPVIIRVGENNSKVTLSDIKFQNVNDTIPRISFTFNRTGKMSVFGDIAVDYISPQGKISRVGIANGIAVYTPNLIRHFQFNLNKIPGIDYKSGTLKIIYSAPSDVKPVKYAEAVLNLN